ncbi:MAG: tetratricopeptide repeat protein [Burkholderiales bacterium]
MPHVDARGITVSGATPDALAAYESSLARLVGGERDALVPIEAALVRAPAFAMGHALRAAASVIDDDRADAFAAALAVAAIQRSEAAAKRERRHAAAAQAWIDGDAARSLALYGALADDYPRDLLALRVALALDFRVGSRNMLRDRVARALPHWSDEVPGYGHVVAMHAFGLEENGDYDAAEAAALRALGHEPRCASAIHTLAHVCEMRGRAADGIALLQRTRGVWATHAGFAPHILWHLAVFHVDQGETDRALAIYDDVLAPRDGLSPATLVDASSLLWRLELRGVAAHRRWRVLARSWARQRLRGARAFNVVHAVMAQAGARRIVRARRAAALLQDDAETLRANRQDDVDLASAFSTALIAFARGHYREAVDRIDDVRAQADRCGGSVAQCDLIHLTLIEAALRAQRDRLARALVAERALRRPTSRLSRWLFARATATPA